MKIPTPAPQKAESEQCVSFPYKVPEDWKVVPVKATKEMIDALRSETASDYGHPIERRAAADYWETMVSAAPQPPVPTAPASGEQDILSQLYAAWQKTPPSELLGVIAGAIQEIQALRDAGAVVPASGGSAVAVEEVERLRSELDVARFLAGGAQDRLRLIAGALGLSGYPSTDKFLAAIHRIAASQANDRVREAALEEAARVVDQNQEVYSNRIGKHLEPRGDGNTMGNAYAAAIRALKADTKTTPGPVEDGSSA